MHISATDLHASYLVVTPFTLPDQSGSLLRGVLGRALRQAGCARRDAGLCAAECSAPIECTYARLFDPPAPTPAPHRFLEGATRAPPRIIPLLPLLGRTNLAARDRVTFGARVLGQFKDDDENRLIEALEGVADRPLGTDGGRVTFDSVTRSGRRNRVVEMSCAATPATSVRRVSRLRVVLETPAWIEHKGRLIEELTFSTLFRTIYRRLSVICALYGELADDHERAFSQLDSAAREIKTPASNLRRKRWVRLSEERGARHAMCGILGWAEFEGDLGPFLPVLAMAEVVHVGKATSFGLGRIRVERQPA